MFRLIKNEYYHFLWKAIFFTRKKHFGLKMLTQFILKLCSAPLKI